MTERKLPEEFAPTGPKLSRFPIAPAPPIRPRLFPDERGFAVRLSLLAGVTEAVAWAVVGRALVERREPLRSELLWAALGVGLLRSLRPVWSRIGAIVSRPLVTAALLAIALVTYVAWLALPARAHGMPLWLAALALGLPAIADLVATAMGDAITVERRPAAYSALDIGEGLGLSLGVAVGAASPEFYFLFLPPFLLILGSVALRDLRDRGTPRSVWPRSLRREAARESAEPILLALAAAAMASAALALSAGTSLFGKALPLGNALAWFCAPLLGMAIASRLEGRLPVLRGAVAVAAIAFALAPHGPDGLGGALGLFALGALASALPAAILRTAAEMHRAAASSLGFTALGLGAGLGALLSLSLR